MILSKGKALYPEAQRSRSSNRNPSRPGKPPRNDQAARARATWARHKDEAVRMLVDDGKTYKEISAAIGLNESTLYAYLGKEATVEEFKRALRIAAMMRYARSQKVLENQLDDANGWLAQGAADRLARLAGPMAMGTEENQSVVIRVEGLAGLGMPQRAIGPQAVRETADDLDPVGLLQASGYDRTCSDEGSYPDFEGDPDPRESGKHANESRGQRREPGKTLRESKGKED